VAAIMAVRPVKRVRVFSPNQAHRDQFAARVRKEFEVDTVCARSVSEAVEGASIITAATRATEPIITGTMVSKGAHINAIGAILPSRAEVASDVLSRCAQIVVDSLPQAQKLARELINFFGDPEQEGWKQVRTLSNLAAHGESRRHNDDLTLFKSL